MPSDLSFRKLTDSQLTWIYANMSIDLDEKIDGMCEKCKKENEIKSCTRCGDKLENKENFEISSSFNEEEFKSLARE